ncbi:MAG: hypothetical protein WC307_04625 [Candidatus Nanoarchaeia archaeon]|jgi:hypothetical protein
MQVLYDDSFQSMVKASILQSVKGYQPVNKPLMDNNPIINANDYTLNELFIEWEWANGTPHDVSGLESAVNYALRHQHASKELVFKIINQALEYGVDYVLTRRSYEAKRFCNMVYNVRNELRAAKLNMKFIHNGRKIIGRYYYSHRITDLLLQFYQKRFPEKQVIIATAERFIPAITRSFPSRTMSNPTVRVVEPVMTLQAFL